MSICLAMIVKNEAHCIRRCLESMRPFISYWVICDTGSTDLTESVVRDTLHGIPGEFHHSEWRDFSHNRNQSLELARDKADYVFMIDADDYLEADKYSMKDLQHDVYDVQFRHGSCTYHRPQLFKNSLNAKYVGVLHEYLSLPPGTKAVPLKKAHIVFGASGARTRDPQKFFKDSILLEEALQKEPHNERYMFYLAQSYRDAGLLDKACLMYFKRFAKGGWIEETYVAILEAAKLYEKLNPKDFQQIEDMYLTAYRTVPTRAESLFYLAKYYRSQDCFEKGYLVARAGLSIKPHDGLFVEPAAFQWQLQDECAVSAYWCGLKDEARQLNQALLKNPHVPAHEKPRIQQNLSFC